MAVLSSKHVGDGFILSVETYSISDPAAKALGKMPGDVEVVLRLHPEDAERAGYTGGATEPRVSRFLTLEDYQRLYDRIGNPADFQRAQDLLRKIRSKDDASKLDSMLKDFGQR